MITIEQVQMPSPGDKVGKPFCRTADDVLAADDDQNRARNRSDLIGRYFFPGGSDARCQGL